ncbi:Na+ dependent nucleoside transporter C-terminus-domain-containing protein [Epithele typhae]|uniref:Na+ dependent nucleoside transporter C-terminus-domain-containing protein n=1 Tax=Epithele typhae TaxID=378194 RepID=UPI002007C0CD|nr:Na+ dependent nucleoside transporter C-terminus-domain-containing protein [Epithele typhae]KAH9940401.1 Na+ dependent nucleoside transporter C-terminus-domain-containing protein [Epithele typhae]
MNSSEITTATPAPDAALQRTQSSRSSGADSIRKEPVTAAADPTDVEKAAPPAPVDEDVSGLTKLTRKYRAVVLAALAALILGWWISATVLQATRHRWIVQSFWAWFFLIVIAFRFIPTSIVTKPVEAVWVPAVQTPFFKLPYMVRLGMGWLALLGIIFGSAFGFPLTGNTGYGDRAISVLGLFVYQFGFWATSKHRSHIPWPTVIVGLFAQQAIAMFVLKSGAGFSIFKWIAFLASDFLDQALQGAAFFFDQETVGKHWFFVNTLSSIIFFIAFVQMFYYLGVMQWLIKGFAWFFFKIMNVSGAEAVVAAASPFIGQGESACLVKPYVDYMTESELHLTMTSGFSTIAGSVLAAYIGLGVPPQNLVTASVMSIPASISISKLRCPEMDEPVTRGRVTVDRGVEKDAPANALHAFSKGALFGLIVAGQILTNVLTVVSLVATINGLLTYIGKGFGIHALTLQLILRYVFYPVTFFMGVPRAEILRVAELLATKLVANEFVAYTALKEISASDSPLSPRAYTIASYALCGFANLGSLGIQIGVLSALAPSRAKIIARIAGSAMICGFISTLQAAGIAGMLV